MIELHHEDGQHLLLSEASSLAYHVRHTVSLPQHFMWQDGRQIIRQYLLLSSQTDLFFFFPVTTRPVTGSPLACTAVNHSYKPCSVVLIYVVSMCIAWNDPFTLSSDAINDPSVSLHHRQLMICWCIKQTKEWLCHLQTSLIISSFLEIIISSCQQDFVYSLWDLLMQL